MCKALEIPKQRAEEYEEEIYYNINMLFRRVPQQLRGRDDWHLGAP